MASERGTGKLREEVKSIQEQLESVVFGQRGVVNELLIALLAGGHVLIEGVPGTGKTRLARTLTQLIGGVYQRIQFTPDLMPSDILGNAYYDMSHGTFEIRQGPIFANVVLADEINRTPPKTQAALLEAMEERQVSIYGESRPLPHPFFVIATQNPIEYEGTYPLPEAQLDRFLMQIRVDYPDEAAEVLMLQHHRGGMGEDGLARLAPVVSTQDLFRMMREVQNVTASEAVLVYIVQLARRSRNVEGISLGASPRAATALLDAAKAAAYIDERNYVIPDDIHTVIHPVWRHRILLMANAELEGVEADAVISRILEQVEVPR